ncbi:hypothetical protein ACNOYE_39300 [Nannocystaceae bacterium ST9]
MAHIVVYLQRTTRGLHPGSLAALCVAREVADARGAAVLSLCLGDAGAFDDRVVIEASRAGTDQLVFLGPEGIQKLVRRLQPRHVISSYTREASSVLAQAGIGPMVGRWIGGPPGPTKLEPVIGAVAGALPWQQSPLQIEPEYETDVSQVELPDWLVAAAERATDLTTTHEQPPLVYCHPGQAGATPTELDAETLAALTSLGAYAVSEAAIGSMHEATVLWFDQGEGLPISLFERNPGVRVILLTGDRSIAGPIDSSWGLADYVLPGAWSMVLKQFGGPAWKTAFV